jgi:hypothetical protein
MMQQFLYPRRISGIRGFMLLLHPAKQLPQMQQRLNHAPKPLG